MSGYDTRQIIRGQWTSKDDWYNESLFKEYAQAARDAIRDLDAGITYATHNPRLNYDDENEIGFLQYLIGVWSPVVRPTGGIIVRVNPSAFRLFLSKQAPENKIMLPLHEQDYNNNAYMTTTEKLRQALESEFFKLEKRLTDEGILPITPPANKQELKRLQPNPTPAMLPNSTKRNGRRPEYDSETMCLAVIEWRELQAQPRRASDLDFDDALDDAPAKRMTKIEFLANKFNGGDVNNLAVPLRTFDYWAQQFDKGRWEIPKQHKKRYEKLKAKE